MLTLEAHVLILMMRGINTFFRFFKFADLFETEASAANSVEQKDAVTPEKDEAAKSVTPRSVEVTASADGLNLKQRTQSFETTASESLIHVRYNEKPKYKYY